MEESIIATIVAGILGGIGLAIRRRRRRRMERRRKRGQCPACGSRDFVTNTVERGEKLCLRNTCQDCNTAWENPVSP